MNRLDHQLDRLFRAASKSMESSQAVVPPYGLETRIVAAWRGTPAFHFWDTRLLVRGLILAAALMALSLWPTLTQHKTVANPFSDYLQLADSDATVPFDATP